MCKLCANLVKRSNTYNTTGMYPEWQSNKNTSHSSNFTLRKKKKFSSLMFNQIWKFLILRIFNI